MGPSSLPSLPQALGPATAAQATPAPVADTLTVAPQAPAKEKFAWVARVIHGRTRILMVKGLDTYYYQPEGSPIYKELDDTTLTEWVRDIWIGAFGCFTPKDIKDAKEVVKIMTDEKMESVNSDNIYITEGLYWNKKRGELVGDPTGPVFYKMFDTSYPDKHTIKVEPFTEEQKEHLLDKYHEVQKSLTARAFKCEYEFINTWAKGNKDVAIDLIRMNAYCFLDKKPLGSGILVGLKRNGKSAYVDMLHTEFGDNNTSRVQLSQLGDPHYTHTLRFSLLNAPDEEEEQSIQYQGLFKTMSDHGVLTLPVMRSNVPIRVPCDFMSFFPMNHTPEWRGSGASACVARSLIMPFENDLSQYDKTSKNFREETFTADMFSDYLGTVFAYAWYYHRHDHEFSEEMQMEQEAVQRDLDSSLHYRRQFEHFFDGFEALKTLYTDYQYWCNANELKIATFKQFKFVFKPYLTSRQKIGSGENRRNVYRYQPKNKASRQVLTNDYKTKEWTLGKLHSQAQSMVTYLFNKYQDMIKDL